MSHGKNIKAQKDAATDYKKRLGILMFSIYFTIYAAFVVINVANPEIMGTHIFLGLNLAIVYGFVLILFAIILGLIYNHKCTSAENRAIEAERANK